MIRIACMLALLLAAPAAAQDREATFRLGNDVYRAGMTLDLGAEGIDDAFAAGERVDLSAPITGSAHLTGRRVNVDAEVGRDLYAAGADVTVTAPVAGDASLAGYDINVESAIGEDLRATGANIRVTGPVGGTGLLAARHVTLEGVITGDAAIAAEELDFGPNARIDGTLMLYGEDVNELSVPERVAPADRIERTDVEEEFEQRFETRRPGPIALVGGFLVGVVIVALLATLAATLAPQNLERARDLTRDRPLRTFWIGFLALSSLIGASVLLVLTLVGIFVAPAVIVLAVALGFLGYVIAVYLIGRALLGWFGALPPDTLAERALAALIGAAVVGVIALVPFLGWLSVLILTLTGLGAFTVVVLRPELRTT